MSSTRGKTCEEAKMAVRLLGASVLAVVVGFVAFIIAAADATTLPVIGNDFVATGFSILAAATTLAVAIIAGSKRKRQVRRHG
jgi:hypothetical protein